MTELVLTHEALRSELRRTVNCLSFKPHRSGTLRGFASVHVPRLRMRIHGIVLHEKDGRRWAQLPAQVLLRDGQILRSDDGKPRYSEPLIEFDFADIGFAFSDAIVQAVCTYAPDAFCREG